VVKRSKEWCEKEELGKRKGRRRESKRAPQSSFECVFIQGLLTGKVTP
jgi:hypothetical protein